MRQVFRYTRQFLAVRDEVSAQQVVVDVTALLNYETERVRYERTAPLLLMLEEMLTNGISEFPRHGPGREQHPEIDVDPFIADLANELILVLNWFPHVRADGRPL